MTQLQKKERSKVLLVVVMCLLHRSAGFTENVRKSLEEENLISSLFGGLMILFGGKSRTMCLKIDLNDSQFPNRYEYLGHFWGEFGYWENQEVLCAAEILAGSDMEKFEELAYRDATRLILLNMTAGQLGINVSERLIKRLMKEGDELQANIGFYFAVRYIERDMRIFDELERNPGFPGARSKRQIHKDLKEHLEVFYEFYSVCCAQRKASLLINYILFERSYPKEFGLWLMEEELRESLIAQITLSGKFVNPNQVIKILSLVRRFPCRGADGAAGKKDRLYAAIVSVLKAFLREEKGFYQWDKEQEQKFREICMLLPQKYLRQYRNFAEKSMSGLMVSELDEMVRFSIYLKDRRQWDICRGMVGVIEESIGR